MIEARFSKREDRFSLSVSGHAGYSSTGDDIVCSAVSGIVYALAGYLVNECCGAEIKALQSGYALLECDKDGDGAMRMAYIGLLQLALSYPAFIRVDCDAWRVNIGTARDVVA